MNFFLYQPESLVTINAIFGQMFGRFPWVMIFGAIFLVVFCLAILFSKFFKWQLKNVVIIIIGLAWLPLLIQFSYSSIVEFKAIANFIGASEAEQINWRFCNLDKNYRLGGGFCNIYPFTKEIEAIVPLGSKIHIISTNIVVYLKYYLYGSYNIVDLKSADYIILYMADTKFLYEAEKLYSLQGDVKDYLGDFSILRSYSQTTVIFKRQIK